MLVPIWRNIKKINVHTCWWILLGHCSPHVALTSEKLDVVQLLMQPQVIDIWQLTYNFTHDHTLQCWPMHMILACLYACIQTRNPDLLLFVHIFWTHVLAWVKLPKLLAKNTNTTQATKAWVWSAAFCFLFIALVVSYHKLRLFGKYSTIGIYVHACLWINVYSLCSFGMGFWWCSEVNWACIPKAYACKTHYDPCGLYIVYVNVMDDIVCSQGTFGAPKISRFVTILSRLARMSFGAEIIQEFFLVEGHPPRNSNDKKT